MPTGSVGHRRATGVACLRSLDACGPHRSVGASRESSRQTETSPATPAGHASSLSGASTVFVPARFRRQSRAFNHARAGTVFA